MLSAFLGFLSYSGIALAVLWLALLSRRLGSVTHASPMYIGLIFGASLVAASALLRFASQFTLLQSLPAIILSMMYNGLPALGLTISVVFAWRYWSWLFAERD